MAQITNGLHSILSIPIVYSLFQKMLGADEHTRQFVDKEVRPVSGMAVLDVGSGLSDVLAYFPAVDYWGFDINASYIAHAKNRYRNRGNFFCKLLTDDDLAAMPKFDIVLLSGVLHHLDDSEAKNLIYLAYQSLKPKGRLVTLDACIVPKQNPIARFMMSQDRGRNVRNEQGYRQLVEGIFSDFSVNIKPKGWVRYTHCIMQCVK